MERLPWTLPQILKCTSCCESLPRQQPSEEKNLRCWIGCFLQTFRVGVQMPRKNVSATVQTTLWCCRRCCIQKASESMLKKSKYGRWASQYTWLDQMPFLAHLWRPCGSTIFLPLVVCEVGKTESRVSRCRSANWEAAKVMACKILCCIVNLTGYVWC